MNTIGTKRFFTCLWASAAILTSFHTSSLALSKAFFSSLVILFMAVLLKSLTPVNGLNDKHGPALLSAMRLDLHFKHKRIRLTF